MTKLWCAVALLAGLLAPAAQALEIGGPAPALELTKVVKGPAVAASPKDSGQIYVVEFWATWCAPCRESTPHLTELQKKYADKNVRIIGISDETEAQVQTFMDQMGDSMDYTVALDDGGTMWKAFAVPFGLEGIPHAFVVDSAGMLMWHGSPLGGELDNVLAMVVDGSLNVETARAMAAQAAIQGELRELTMLWAQEYLVLSKYGRDKAGADAIGQKLLDCGYTDPVFYGQFAWTLLINTSLAYQDPDFALKVATFANELAKGESADVLDTLAFALFRSGQVADAVATQKKAITICDNDALMEQLKGRLAQYEKS